MNKWLGSGNARNIKTGVTKTGNAWARFQIAATSIWWDPKSRSEKVKTTWVSCVAWSKQAETVRDQVQVNTEIFVIGRYQVSKGRDNKWYHEIVADSIEIVGKPKSGRFDDGFGGDDADFDLRSGEEFEAATRASKDFEADGDEFGGDDDEFNTDTVSDDFGGKDDAF